jgi:hypothetical protein
MKRFIISLTMLVGLLELSAQGIYPGINGRYDLMLDQFKRSGLVKKDIIEGETMFQFPGKKDYFITIEKGKNNSISHIVEYYKFYTKSEGMNLTKRIKKSLLGIRSKTIILGGYKYLAYTNRRTGKDYCNIVLGYPEYFYSYSGYRYVVKVLYFPTKRLYY